VLEAYVTIERSWRGLREEGILLEDCAFPRHRGSASQRAAHVADAALTAAARAYRCVA
jgi:hypothetical protein